MTTENETPPTAGQRIRRTAKIIFATFGWPLLLLAATTGGGAHIAAYFMADAAIAQHCKEATDFYEQAAECTRALSIKAEINAFIFHALRFGIVVTICGGATAALFSRTRKYLTKALANTTHPVQAAGCAIALAIVFLASAFIWSATA